MLAKQPAGTEAMADLRLGHARRQQLSPRHHAVRPFSNPADDSLHRGR
jgi:hypothetical protein